MKTSTGCARIGCLARMMTAGELLPIEGRNMSEGGVEALNPEQLERLASYFDEEAYQPQTTKSLGLRFSALLPDAARNVRWEPGLHPL
jgi:hypothetical protein